MCHGKRVFARVCLTGLECMSSCCSAEMSHLSRWEGGSLVSQPGLLPYKEGGRLHIFLEAKAALNEFILLCGRQRHAPLWEKVPE